MADVAQALAYASALRFTRFPTSNEFGDWDTVLHHLHLLRLPGPDGQAGAFGVAGAGVLHGAMVLHLGRFLNIPPARLPSERELQALPAEGERLTARLLQLCDAQSQVDEAAAVVYRYLTLGHDLAPCCGRWCG